MTPGGHWLSWCRVAIRCYQRILSNGNALKIILNKPHNNVRIYSHSFTLVCCCAIPVNSSWVVGFRCLAVKSRRVSSRGRLGQNVGQRRKLFGHRRPAVSFLSRGQKQAGLQVVDIQAEGVNSLFQPLFTHFKEGIIASGFIPAHFRSSEVVCCDHD